MVFAIGYRVRSNIGVHFRNWASSVLTEYSKKGFAMNDEHLKNPQAFGEDYCERKFDESLLSLQSEKVSSKEEKRLFEELIKKDEKINETLDKIKALQDELEKAKAVNIKSRHFEPIDLSEFETRKKYIDLDLKFAGWEFGKDLIAEVPVIGMPNDKEEGFADYVLYGENGRPLAVVEAKRTSKDPKVGKHQAFLYADCLEKMTGQRPIIFYSNGFETWIWDDKFYPERLVSGVSCKDDLQRLLDRRKNRKKLSTIAIADRITDRYYQKEAIRAVCDNFEKGIRKALLVMATGAGKTRTAASLSDVLMRGEWVTNILFLADRTELVGQAYDSFKENLPSASLCNLLKQKESKRNRIVFSTYPTIMNSIDNTKLEDGLQLFTPAHFDIIIIDEAHRSIFKKYRAIFEYFDALLVGLTATPKNEVDHNTYEFFDLEDEVPTYAYELNTATYIDKVLVKYHLIETTYKFIEEGITYDELSEKEKEKYEDIFDEEEEIPEYIESNALNSWLFNLDTIDKVLQDLMKKGQKIEGGDRLGKTIIFASNHNHAVKIEERFNALYPQYKGEFARVIDHKTNYASDILKKFKGAEKTPYIAISVDMLDTGIDVPEILNLVFFKRVRSKTKFWQMIGRGTRLCKDVFGKGQDKECFYIFDVCSNFEYFRENPKGIKGNEAVSLSETIFNKRVVLTMELQNLKYGDESYIEFRKSLVNILCEQVKALNLEQFAVKMARKYVERFSNTENWISISENDKNELSKNISSLVFMDEQDEKAKRFDNLMYSLMISQIENTPAFKRFAKDLRSTALALSKKGTIPQVKAKKEIINEVLDEHFITASGILDFERIRIELRELIKFIEVINIKLKDSYLTDTVLDVKEGGSIDSSEEYENYRLKVNRFIEQNKDNIAIYKLRNNLLLTKDDYALLEKILMSELGTPEEYHHEYGNTPFGLLVRKIAKLDIEAANKAFSEFLNEQIYNHEQIRFVKTIVDYVVQNGFVEDLKILSEPPFDKPAKILELFDKKEATKIVGIVNKIKENAEKVAG